MKSCLSLIIVVVLLFFAACRKDRFITSPDARVSLSADTLKFDTVFTSTGSVTQSFKIVNDNNQQLRLSSVKLMGGTGSSFHLNVDGVSTAEARDIEIAANDSIYVFVQVKINPAAPDLPFVVRDSIQVTYNGNSRLVQLEAWGQNAHFFRNKEITGNETWTNDRPYVLLGYLYIAEDAQLNIQQGVRIYAHADAPVIVDGTLQVNGGKDTTNRVYFQGDRMDEPYKNYPAAWPGIYFRSSSKNNVLNYAVINNTYQAIAVEDPSPTAAPKLVLNQCVIDNGYDAGIIGLNSSITAINTLISNCGKNIYLSKGGNYQFSHCTVVSYSNNYISHKDPVVTINDQEASTATNVLFRNCIFWGESGLVDNELRVSKTGTQPFAVNVDQAIWKMKEVPAAITLTTPSPINQAPLFDSIDVTKRYYNFRLRENSPALNAGKHAGILIDLDGRTRPVGLPDLGCFERP